MFDNTINFGYNWCCSFKNRIFTRIGTFCVRYCLNCPYLPLCYIWINKNELLSFSISLNYKYLHYILCICNCLGKTIIFFIILFTFVNHNSINLNKDDCSNINICMLNCCKCNFITCIKYAWRTNRFPNIIYNWLCCDKCYSFEIITYLI